MTPPRTAVRRFALARAISVTGKRGRVHGADVRDLRQTGSAGWLAASLLVTEGVTGVVAPLTSVLGDRFDRRKVMILSDLAAAVCFAGMAFASVPGPLVLVALLSAFAEAPFWPASGAAIPNLVPQDQVELGEQPDRRRPEPRHHARPGDRRPPARRRRSTCGLR